MYNEERKSQFIQETFETGSTKKYVRSLMGRIGKHESALCCDYADMTQEKADYVLSMVSDLSNSSIDHNKSIIRAYLKWCKEHGVNARNSIELVDIDFGLRIRRSYVSSPSHLLQTLDYLLPAPEDASIRFVLRAYIWLAFMGLEENEAIRVVPDNLDYCNMKLTLDRSMWYTYSIYMEAMRDLLMASSLTEFRTSTGVAGVWFRQRARGNNILRRSGNTFLDNDADIKDIRGTYSKNVKGRRLEAKRQIEALSDISPDITFGNVFNSGIFYRIYQEECGGITPNFDKYIDVDLKRRAAKWDEQLPEKEVRKHWNNIRREYERQYDRWKRAFELK